MGDRVEDVGEMRKVAIGDIRQPCGPAGDVAGLGDHRKGGLPMKLHETIGKHWLVMQVARADVVGMRHVPGGEHADDAGYGGDGREVHRGDLRVRPVGHAECAMQRAHGFRHVVDIVGGAGDMLVGAVVALRRVHLAPDCLAFLEGGLVHDHLSPAA
ncbi:hypothetical protein D9M72_505420 [compost metagenome]